VPELPDLTVYIHALNTRVAGRRLVGVRLISPFVLRSVDPPLEAVKGRTVQAIFRLGKRIVLKLAAPTASPSSTTPSSVEDELFLVVHLMIAGRLRWREPHQKPGVAPRMILAAFEFEHGTLLFTEASSKKRASLQLVSGRPGVETLNPGGVEPLEASLAQFRESLTRESHTLKRALTDPRLFSGIGNAYSDEILHAGRLSPLKLSRTLSDEESLRLYEATRATLTMWIERLETGAAGAFPEKVTAFRDEMAVHGRFKKPCPVCGAPVQRIVYADNECNYCARCQTGGRLLADRSLSRLLKADWPRYLEDE
jgi:formamidopyrimidine-DNA glycosylase